NNAIYDAKGILTDNSSIVWGVPGVITRGDSCHYYYSPTCASYYELSADTIPHHYYAVNMASGTSPLTYSWSWGDGSTDSVPFPSHTYDTAGFYAICLTISDASGCTDTFCNSYNLLKASNAMVEVNVIPSAPTG